MGGASPLTPEGVGWGGLRAWFARADSDGTGAIDKAELGRVCEDLNLPASLAAGFLEEVDADGDGRVDFAEVLEAYGRAAEAQRLEEEAKGRPSSVYVYEGPAGGGACSTSQPAALFGEVLGSQSYREGATVPAPLPSAGVWNLETRTLHQEKPLLFNAHASHLIGGTGGAVTDGVTPCCTRAMSWRVKGRGLSP